MRGNGTIDRERMTSPAVSPTLRLAAALAMAMAFGLAGCASSAARAVLDRHAAARARAGTPRPASTTGAARFREIYCAVLEARVGEVPDHRPCDDALTRLGTEPAGTGRPVALGASSRRLVAAVVPGIGYDCFAKWLQPPGTVAAHVRKYGYEQRSIKVDALVRLARTTRARSATRSWPWTSARARRAWCCSATRRARPTCSRRSSTIRRSAPRVAAVVSVAGAVGGSPLANDAEQYQADLLRHFPGATCDSGDGGAVASLRPATRRAWLAQNPLPRRACRPTRSSRLPQPERISSILRGSAEKLARSTGATTARCSSTTRSFPARRLVGYVNADHWAIVVPIARTHDTIGSLFVTAERLSARSVAGGGAALRRGRPRSAQGQVSCA